ncbi:cation diffusion facilitator family transporter [Kurthia sibirica]|uniref:Cation-efflux pump n=1 Tax=Kurthia sibirica TaxID=202750 RepID=A0A2U3ALL1_9BACL|nr:cation diffusion facilitator family transporter [Kurthia sibirica]PWI25425.1 cation-efflux pump [Kurthia sibirica]GEK34339.1 putative transporter YdfM [Kurthia sibirica]
MPKRQSMLAAWISVISNVCLTIIKIVCGVLFKSQVLLADGIHNAADVVASGVSLGSMKISNQPADDDHPYGHGKAEVLSSAFVAIILFLAALYIAYGSILALFNPSFEAHWIAFVAAIVSLVWKLVLYKYTMTIGRREKSNGLIATAYDHLADVYASLAAVIGIGLSLANTFITIPFAQYADPVAGIIVAVLIIRLSITMIKDSTAILMEASLPMERNAQYAEVVAANEFVKRIDSIRARTHGHYVLVDVRVGVPATLSVQQGHDVCKQLKSQLKAMDEEVSEVLVHLNPWYPPEPTIEQHQQASH